MSLHVSHFPAKLETKTNSALRHSSQKLAYKSTFPFLCTSEGCCNPREYPELESALEVMMASRSMRQRPFWFTWRSERTHGE